MTAPIDLRDIVARLGGDLYNGGSRANVPGPGHSKRDRSLSLRQMPNGRIVYHSFAPVDHAEVLQHLGIEDQVPRRMSAVEAAQARVEREREGRASDERRRKFCDEIWRSTSEAAGTPVETYLRGPRAVTGPIPACLRYSSAVPLGYQASAPQLPAMVALAHRPNGDVAGLHATFLLPDGSGKADLPDPRRMFWSLGGGAVRLGPPANRDGVLAVAEGVETALSYRDLTRVPTWAAGSTAGLSRFVPPPKLTWLMVAADSDDTGAGLAAARELAARVRRRCRVTLASAPQGKDWNTVAMEGTW
jgi:hypothetical protein